MKLSDLIPQNRDEVFKVEITEGVQLDCVSYYSDKCQIAHKKLHQYFLENLMKAKTEDEKDLARLDFEVKYIAACVVGWNLETKFTQEDLLLLLRSSPKIRGHIDSEASLRGFFTKQQDATLPKKSKPQQKSTNTKKDRS